MAGGTLTASQADDISSGASEGQSRITESAQGSQFEIADFVLPVLGLVILAIILGRYRQGVARYWGAWRKRRNESEARYFRLLIKSIQANDGGAALRDLMRWLDRINHRDRPAQLEEFLARYADEATQKSVTAAVGAMARCRIR